MNTTRYATRDEAITREIVEPIEAGGVEDAYAEFDINCIADIVLDSDRNGYFLAPQFDSQDDAGEAFWNVVQDYAIAHWTGQGWTWTVVAATPNATA